MNAKRRLEELERRLGHRRAPSWDEMIAARERIGRRLMWKLDAFFAERGLRPPPTDPPPGGDDAEDSAIVEAYDAAHNIPREDPEVVRADILARLERIAQAQARDAMRERPAAT